MPQTAWNVLPALSEKTLMAQTLPPTPDASAPLPRYERKRTGAAKAPRPRFQAADAALTVLFAALFLVMDALVRGWHTELALALLTSALTAGMTYLLGWRCGGRTCGIIAGGLTALSFGFAQASVLPGAALLTLLSVAALLAFACDAPVIACVLAGSAAALRPDGALLGLLLLALTAVRAPRLFLLSLGGAVAAALLGGSVRVFVLHLLFPIPVFHVGGEAASWLAKPAQAFTLWLLIPLCAEMTDPARRVRWLPSAVWGALYLALALCVRFGGSDDMALPLMPLLFVLAAGGLARLMPSLAGEIPAARYVLATLAIVGLLGLRGTMEQTQHLAAVPASEATAISAPQQPPPARDAPGGLPQASPPALVVPRRVKAVRPVKRMPPSSIYAPLTVHPIAKKPIQKPAVALYALRNGRLVHRSKWAIQWDLTHPKTGP